MLRDVKHPHILDCGPACPATINVLLKRGAKIYVADLVTLAQQSGPRFLRQAGKTPLFLVDEFLDHLPDIPPGSLSAIACWHLLDLIPREAVAGVVARLWSELQPKGGLFCLLREPGMAYGAGTRWWLENLTTLGLEAESKTPFIYPAITNREIERLLPGSDVKTYLTRTARREILAIK